LRQICPGIPELWSDKQTNRDYNFIHIEVELKDTGKNWEQNITKDKKKIRKKKEKESKR